MVSADAGRAVDASRRSERVESGFFMVPAFPDEARIGPAEIVKTKA
jgi:hypothetical protein